MTNNFSLGNLFNPNSNCLNINTIYCTKHNSPYEKYCSNCSLDLCIFCESFHINHNILPYENIIPTNKEISLITKTIDKYTEDYNNILLLISDWQNKIDRLILNFQNQLKNNNIMKFNINYIYNYKKENTNFTSILKFRKIVKNLLGNQNEEYNIKMLNYLSKINNDPIEYNNINDLGLFSYSKYTMLKILLEKLDIDNNDSINFITKSNLIVKYLWNSLNNNSDKEKKLTRSENSISCKNLLNSPSLKKNFNKSYNGSIIEKYITFTNSKKAHHVNKLINLRNKIVIPNKKSNIFLENNNTIQSSTTKLKIIRKQNSNKILFKGNTLNYKHSLSNKNISKLNIFDDFRQRKIYSMKKSKNKKNNWTKKEEKSKLYITNNENNKKNNNQKKSFIHRKYEINTNNMNFLKNSSNQSILTNDNNIQGNSNNSLNLDIKITTNDNKVNNLLNSTFSNIKSNKCISLEKNLYNDFCHDSLNTNFKFSHSSKKFNSSTYNPNIFDISNNYSNNIKLIKTPFNHKFILGQNKCLCLGLELGNKVCKMGIINRNYNEKKHSENVIELICFKENEYKIPSYIYFDENSEDVKIGYDAENFLENKPNQVIYNFFNNIGKSYNEIKEKNNMNFLTYNLICAKNNLNERPYIKIIYNNQKEKIFSYEEILTIYLKKLFEIFFNKIIYEKEKNNIIPIILVVTIPTYFNYFQRKIVEKIIRNKIFPTFDKSPSNLLEFKQDATSMTSKYSTTTSSSQFRCKHKVYSGYQIMLKDFKIENCSFVACLSLNYNNNTFLNTNEKNSSNILIVDLNDGIDISLVFINEEMNCKKIDKVIIYEVKNNNSTEINRNFFFENYLENYFKRLLKITEFEELIKKPFEKIKIKKIYNNMCENNNKEIIINIQNKKYKINIDMIEYEKILIEEFSKITSIIKSILKKSKLSEKEIDNILLLGSLTKKTVFKKVLKDLFKFNKTISNKLFTENSTENYQILEGALMKSFYISNKIDKFKLKVITTSSFGVETLDGYMDFIIEKGSKIPIKNQKFIKINKNSNKDDNKYLEINVYEGDNVLVSKNRNISSVNIDKKNFKNDKIGNNYIEILMQFEIDKNYNLRVYVLDPQTLRKRFECLINTDIIKGN